MLLALLAGACRDPTSADEKGATGVAAAPIPSSGCRPGTFDAIANERRRVVVDGVERSFLLDAPGGTSDRPQPLVLVFHGFRHDAAGLRAGSGFTALAASGAAVVVHPEGRPDVRLLNTVGRGWDTGPGETLDIAFARAILDALERERCLDRRRLYATGFSNGGFVSNLLGCALADRLAAVAPIAGARALDDCRPATPLPILLMHGAADRVVPLGLSKAARAWWQRSNHCGTGQAAVDGCEATTGCAADVVWCEGPQAHVWPAGTIERVWRFFQDHPRS
jgi:polyhydroxybutyrate depolymerase